MNCVGFLILLFLILFCLSCKGQVPNLQTIEKKTVEFGSTARLKGTFEGNSSTNLITWSFTRRSLIYAEKFRPEKIASKFRDYDFVINNSSLHNVEIEMPATLVLKNVDECYSGIYKFQVQAAGFDIDSEFDLYIAETPNVTFTCLSRNEVNEGDNFTCVCKGENGNPPANVTWYKDGVQIGGTGTEEKTLTLINVNETSNGTYKCEARSHTNDSFADEKSIKLIVRQLDKPNITSFTVTPDPVANQGKKVTITCISKGVPSPNNTIIRNGTKSKRPRKRRSPAKFDRRIWRRTEKTSTEVSTEKTSTTYTIDSVTPGDAGIYTCIAENKVGNDSATLNLTVQVGPSPTSPRTKKWNAGYLAFISLIFPLVLIVALVYCFKEKSKGRGNINSVEPGEPGPEDEGNRGNINRAGVAGEDNEVRNGEPGQEDEGNGANGINLGPIPGQELGQEGLGQDNNNGGPDQDNNNGGPD